MTHYKCICGYHHDQADTMQAPRCPTCDEAMMRMLINEPEACSNCHFSDPSKRFGGDESLNCRKHSPLPMPASGGRVFDARLWPVMQQWEWCGDYKRKDAKPSTPTG